MRVRRVVLLTREHAVLQLRPSWLARLFGAPDLMVELECQPPENEHQRPAWVSKYTRTPLSHMLYSGLIQSAMEAYPISDIPVATALQLKETS